MDTDALLQPVNNPAGDQVEALKNVVRANTAALKEIRADLDSCNNADKVNAIKSKVEKAMEDLSIESQKLQPWVTAAELSYGAVAYGQYPINQPLNRDNPVPRSAIPVVTGNIKKLSAVDATTAAIDMPPGHYSRFTDGDQVTISDTGTSADGALVTLMNGDGKDTFQCSLAVTTTASKGTITKGG